MSVYHTPVLLEESIELLGIKADGVYVDLTFGGGGHSRRILSALDAAGKLFAFDQDNEARANIPDDPRLTFVRSNFRFMRAQLRLLGIREADGILADLGVSSHHFDTPERGFSFRSDAPLDMRMNREGELSAAKIINEYPEEELIRIFRDWGELDGAGPIARLIVQARSSSPITTTFELIEMVKPRTPRAEENKFLSKLFQALRIEVNHEMEALKMAMEQSLKILRPGGRLVVISYHSLEDRLVKNFLRNGTFSAAPEKDFYGRTQTPFRLLTRKAIVPSEEEIEQNPRSRSAKLRAAEKL